MHTSTFNRHLNIFVLVLVGIVIIASCVTVYARSVSRTRSVHTNRGGGHHRSVSRNVNVHHNYRGHYHGGAALAGMFVGLAIGTAVASIPPASTTVVVQSTTYYVKDGVYYQVVPAGGYVVVPAPPGY